MLAAIADAFDVDLAPLPAHLQRFATEAFQWRSIDDELALVTFDGAVDELVGARGSGTALAVRFEARGIAVEVARTGSSMVIAIEPDGVYRCTVDGPDVAIEAETDTDGALVTGPVPLPLRVTIHTDHGRVVGPWITG